MQQQTETKDPANSKLVMCLKTKVFALDQAVFGRR